jgi:hypothetical protein
MRAGPGSSGGYRLGADDPIPPIAARQADRPGEEEICGQPDGHREDLAHESLGGDAGCIPLDPAHQHRLDPRLPPLPAAHLATICRRDDGLT